VKKLAVDGYGVRADGEGPDAERRQTHRKGDRIMNTTLKRMMGIGMMMLTTVLLPLVAEAASLMSLKNETGHTLVSVKVIERNGDRVGNAVNVSNGKGSVFVLPRTGSYTIYIAYREGGRMVYAKGTPDYIKDESAVEITLEKIVSSGSDSGVISINEEEFNRL
jgi:hypothetical protein